MSALSDQELAVVTDLERVLRSPVVDDAYNQLPETFGGKLLNADLARELSRAYRTKYDRIVFTTCTYAPCAAYVRSRFDRVIKEPGKPGERSVLFLAGGAASGKTRSVDAALFNDHNLIFDSNLANFAKACDMIDLALRHGWFVQIVYIHRPFALALEGMIERALLDGRYIPIGPPSKLAQLHFQAQRTIVRLRSAFPEDLVRITALENLWTRETPVLASTISLTELENGGRYWYKSVDELHTIQQEIIDEHERLGIFAHEKGLFRALCETEG